METVILTGANGTIGTILRPELEKRGFNVVCWDRNEVPIDDYQKMFDFIKSSNADILLHLGCDTNLGKERDHETWKSNFHWPSELAWITKELGIEFIFISSALVFAQNQEGPFDEYSRPKEEFGYGGEKKRAEDKVLKQNPNTKIIRLGWQIGEVGKNTMLNNLDSQEKIYASTNWFPSCSFLSETVKFLIDSIYLKPGIYMFNSNDKYSFYEIACKLKEIYKKDWEIIPVKDPIHNQLMLNKKIKFFLFDKFF